MEPLFEQKIIKGMVNKESWAFEQFVDSYQKDIYNLALKYMGNEQDALDVTQEVFLRVLRKIHTFKADSKLSTWVYRITVNYCKDYLIKLKKNKHISIDKPMDNGDGQVFLELEDCEKPPVEILEDKEVKGNLHKCIQKLDVEQKEIIILRYINELSYDEIAGILKIPEGTVKSRLNRARKKLGLILQKEEHS